ncbi:glucosamine-6-phosphate deaminase [Pleomorphovibrio marinus]|uniref:glucosamine-6-phosphate deaminase n=1 Tax=Pleomorphovibrio marinus TaxID=2164132 RepID=UPI000E0C9770|nr:glucosamine-6-phosphate deaminase [Pleomorphovibrio marinus]
MQIKKFDSVEALTEAVAKTIINAVKKKPDLVLGLSTGSSPIGVYKAMVKDHIENGTSYKQVTTFNLDEYVGLAPMDSNSYRHFMNEHLFDHIDILKSQTHVPLGIGNLEENCQKYEEKINSAGGIQLQLLGIGTNGHIAFNEPGASFDALTHIENLTEDTIFSNRKFFENEEQVPRQAITMGIKSILNCEKILLVAYGANKAKVVKGMVEGPVTTSLPASILQKHGNTSLFLDQESASML